jgi:hypothetical protein
MPPKRERSAEIRTAFQQPASSFGFVPPIVKSQMILASPGKSPPGKSFLTAPFPQKATAHRSSAPFISLVISEPSSRSLKNLDTACVLQCEVANDTRFRRQIHLTSREAGVLVPLSTDIPQMTGLSDHLDGTITAPRGPCNGNIARMTPAAAPTGR